MVAERGDLFVVASPSGGGKTTLIRRVIAGLAEQGRSAYFSVSHTTRAPRNGETDGVDYHFVDRATFVHMVERGDFLEHAEVHGNLYGTSRAAVETKLDAGCDVFLDIDVQGARQVRAVLPDAVSVFVLPPSHDVLLERLKARGQDSEAVISLRMHNAVNEMRQFCEFDYVIINDRLEEATRALANIVAAARFRAARMRRAASAIVVGFEGALREE